MSLEPPKPEITLGNILSIVTTIVMLTLAYGALKSKDDVHDTRLNAIETSVAKRELADQVTASRLSTIEGDIRVIRQILEGVRPAPTPR